MTAEVKGTADSASGTTATQAGSATGVGQTDVAAGYRSSGAEVTSDIAQAEAYIVNMKKLVADELDHAANLRSVAAEAIGRRSRNAEDYDQTLRSLAQQSLQNAVSLQNRVSNKSVDHDARLHNYSEGEISRTVRHSDLAIDRQWNVDEVAELVAKTPVFLDAIAAAVASGVAKAVSKEEIK